MTLVWPLGQGTPSVTAIERVTAPVATPISLADAKAQCRVSLDDEDDLISGLIDAAVDLVDGEGGLGRAMITQTWAQWVPQSPGEVTLRMGPFLSLTSVEYYDDAGTLQTATLGHFETQKRGDFVTVKPIDGSTWPNTQNRMDAIKITYTAGYGANATDVPRGIRHALLMLVGHWYENREASTALRLSELQVAVDALLNRHRVGWYG